MTLYKKPFENIVRKGEKGENAFPHMFCTLPIRQVSVFELDILSSANPFDLD